MKKVPVSKDEKLAESKKLIAEIQSRPNLEERLNTKSSKVL